MLSLAIWPKRGSGGGGGATGPLVILQNASTTADGSNAISWGNGNNPFDESPIYYNLADRTATTQPPWLDITDTSVPILSPGTYLLHARVQALSDLPTDTVVSITCQVTRGQPSGLTALGPVPDQLGSATYSIDGFSSVTGVGSSHGHVQVLLEAANTGGLVGTGDWACTLHIIKLV